MISLFPFQLSDTEPALIFFYNLRKTNSSFCFYYEKPREILALYYVQITFRKISKIKPLSP